ncbi:PCSK5 [Symbiodinium sp. CCMP2592]|nr:PCSK5 [Symbiodinium sp. CCMP2592]
MAMPLRAMPHRQVAQMFLSALLLCRFASAAPPCTEGQGFNESSQTCSDCAPGTYMSYVNATANLTFSIGCRPCLAGRYSGAAASVCSVCPAGRWSWAASSSCTACAPGTFSFEGMRDCLPCAPGYFTASEGLSECAICAAGRFSESYRGSSRCTECATGQWSEPASVRCTACTSGEYLDENQTCSVCPAGTSSIQGATSCTACAPGTRSDAGAMVCEPCSPGRFVTQPHAACQDCPGGTFSSLSSTSCDVCPYGHSSLPVSESCLPCPAGRFVLDIAAPCAACAAGRVSSGRTDSCTPCAAGEYSEEAAARCRTCPAGTFSSASSGYCSECPAGTASEEGSASCIPCTAGSISQAGAAKCEPCTAGSYALFADEPCLTCAAGTSSLRGAAECTPCQAGYVSSAGAGECLPCQPGTFTTDLQQCRTCPAGTWSSIAASSCEPCPPGSRSDAGWGACQICPPGTNIQQPDDQCETCPAGTYSHAGATVCDICEAGTFSNTSSNSCTTCPAGRYSNDTAPECTDCPSGRFSPERAAVCTLCPAGTISGEASGSCMLCPAGTFSGIGASVCNDCPAGTFILSPDQTCETCARGRYSTTASTGCNSCIPGTFITDPALNCTSCPAGTWSGMEAAECIRCLPGEFSDEGSAYCSLCPAGTYIEQPNETCMDCPEGTWSSSASVSCSDCLPGRFRGNGTGCESCPPGSRSDAAADMCEECTAGRYSRSASDTCDLCPAGFASEPGSGECMACKPGSFSLAESPSCSICSAGTKSGAEAGMCTACPLGKVSPANASRCRLCPAGRFAPSPDGDCMECPSGTWSTSRSAECTECPEGRWSHPGSRDCAACPPGTYILEGNATCQPCPHRFWSFESSADCEPLGSGSWSTLRVQHLYDENLRDGTGEDRWFEIRPRELAKDPWVVAASAGSAQTTLLLGKEMSAASRDDERPRLERFDGSDPASYKRWRRKAELMLLALPSTMAKEKWGPKLCEFLHGEAEEVCEGISLEKLVSDTGYRLILETLDARYADLEQDALQKYLNEYFFKTQIKAGETYRNLTIRVDTAYRNLQEVKVQLPDEVRGWFLLRKLALDKSSEAMVLTATQGSLKYDDITKAVKSIFPQGKCSSTANRMKDVYAAEDETDEPRDDEAGDGEENEVFQVVADQFQNMEAYDDEEALDVLETYHDIRKKLQQKKMGRGYKSTPAAWSLTGTVQGRLEQLKSKTRCHICKQTGHWKRECPKRRDQPSSSAGRGPANKDTKDAMIADLDQGPETGAGWFVPVEQIEELDVFLVEGSHGEVDIVLADQGEADCEQISAVLEGGLEKSGLLSPRVFDDAPDRAQPSDAYMAECSSGGSYADVTTHAAKINEVHATVCAAVMMEETADAEMMVTENGVPWRSDIAATPLMKELLGALKPELANEVPNALPMKMLDGLDDADEDEPDVPISGREILSIGKYAKAGMMKTFAEIYTEDKGYVQWIRKFVTTTKPNQKGQAPTSPMMKLRLYIAMRDQLKENRVKLDVALPKTDVMAEPPYIDPKKALQLPMAESTRAATPKMKTKRSPTGKQGAALSSGSDAWEKVDAMPEPNESERKGIKIRKARLMEQMRLLSAQMEELEGMLIVSMPSELREMLGGRCKKEEVYCNSYAKFVNAVSMCQECNGRLFAVEVGASLAVSNLFVAAVMDWKRGRDQVVTATCVHAVEDLRNGEGMSDQKIMVLLRKCHENLGHPSPARLGLLLKAAHASDRVLRLARGLTCEACDSLTRPKSHNVTKIRRATEFNQQVCLDTFELEVRGSKLNFLNICDEGTSYQLCVPLWKGKQAKHVRNAYRKAWKRWAGAPIRAFTDGGPEFEAEFEHGLQLDGTFGDKAAAYAPWQNGLTERKGGVWKLAFQKAVVDAVPRSKQEVQELVDNVNVAVNTLTRKDGYSPCQHVFGRELRVPGLISTEYDPVINSGLVQGESVFERRMMFRNAARKAFLEADGDARLRKALEHRSRPERGPFHAGDLVYFWRRHRFENKHHWHGPAVVVGSQSSRVWIAQGTKVYRCCPEQLRRLSPEQEATIKLLPADVIQVRTEVSARGAGTYHDISDQERPPDDDEASEESHNGQPAPQVGASDVELDVEPELHSEELAAPEAEGNESPREDVPMREPRVPSDHGEESPSKRALRRSADLLDGVQRSSVDRGSLGSNGVRAEDVPVPDLSDEELEVTVEKECLMVERTKGRKEVAMSSVTKERRPGLDRAKQKEWRKLLDSKAILVHTGEKAREIREKYARTDQRTGRKEKFMKSRFVVTEAGETASPETQGLKARWCIRGYLDPALMELDTNAPTLTAEGFAVTAQLIASHRWSLQIADVEGAFLRGDRLEEARGRLFIEMPPGGVPGYEDYDDCIIEAVKTVYGLADAPKAWWKSFSRSLINLGMRPSKFDPCVFWYFHKGKLAGTIALHVDDMVLGGNAEFQEHVVNKLKQQYPFKHWKVGAGEFLGKMLRQEPSGEITICQLEYASQLQGISISAERRRQKGEELSEGERQQMRAVLGAVNWLVGGSRPDLAAWCSLLQQKVSKGTVEQLIETNKLVTLARENAAMMIRILPIPTSDIRFVVMSDASWANAENRCSQAGYLVAAVDDMLHKGHWGRFSLMRWRSYKQDRQAHSTLGAELLALSRAIAEARWIRSLWCEAMYEGYQLSEDQKWSNSIPLTAVVDCKPVYDHAQACTVSLKDKRMAIEMLLVKNDIKVHNISLRWVVSKFREVVGFVADFMV